MLQTHTQLGICGKSYQSRPISDTAAKPALAAAGLRCSAIAASPLAAAHTPVPTDTDTNGAAPTAPLIPSGSLPWLCQRQPPPHRQGCRPNPWHGLGQKTHSDGVSTALGKKGGNTSGRNWNPEAPPSTPTNPCGRRGTPAPGSVGGTTPGSIRERPPGAFIILIIQYYPVAGFPRPSGGAARWGRAERHVWCWRRALPSLSMAAGRGYRRGALPSLSMAVPSLRALTAGYKRVGGKMVKRMRGAGTRRRGSPAHGARSSAQCSETAPPAGRSPAPAALSPAPAARGRAAAGGGRGLRFLPWGRAAEPRPPRVPGRPRCPHHVRHCRRPRGRLQPLGRWGQEGGLLSRGAGRWGCDGPGEPGGSSPRSRGGALLGGRCAIAARARVRGFSPCHPFSSSSRGARPWLGKERAGPPSWPGARSPVRSREPPPPPRRARAGLERPGLSGESLCPRGVPAGPAARIAGKKEWTSPLKGWGAQERVAELLAWCPVGHTPLTVTAHALRMERRNGMISHREMLWC